MEDKITGYDTYMIGFDKYKDNLSDTLFTKPEYKLYLLHSTNHYAYFRLFSIRFVGEIGDTNNAIYTEVKELKSKNQKKLKYSLRKDKTNWLGEIPCFKTSCVKHNDNEGNYIISLPFILCCGSNHTPIQPTLKEYNFDPKGIIDYLGNTNCDIVEKQILEQKQKLEPPNEEPQEEPQEEPPNEENELPLTQHKINCLMWRLNQIMDRFEGNQMKKYRNTLLTSVVNMEIDKEMIKFRVNLLKNLKKYIEEKMNLDLKGLE